MLEQYGKVILAVFGIVVVLVIAAAIAISVKNNSTSRVNSMDTQYATMFDVYN